jgi:hypothetical protein
MAKASVVPIWPEAKARLRDVSKAHRGAVISPGGDVVGLDRRWPELHRLLAHRLVPRRHPEPRRRALSTKGASSLMLLR